MATNVLNTLQQRGAPTMAQANNKFTFNNPQFSPAAQPTTPKPSIGQRATSPQDNIQPPKNNLPSGQAAPEKPETQVGGGTNAGTTANSGLVGGASALATGGTPTYPGLVSRLAGYTPNTDPGVQDAQQRQRDFESTYARGQMDRSTQANPFGYQTNLMNINSAGHAALSPVYQSQVQQAYTGAGQGLTALQGATSAAAPQQVAPQNFYVNPLTGQDVSGGTINPFTGGVRTAGYQAGIDYGSGNQSINSARNLGNQFVSAVNSNPDFNSGKVNITNAIGQLISNNLSNSQYPGIQSAFNNVVDQYSQVLGGRDKVIALITAANPTTMQSLINSLDQQAIAVNNSRASYGGVNTPLNPSIQASGNQPTSTGTVAGGGSTYKGISLPH